MTTVGCGPAAPSFELETAQVSPLEIEDAAPQLSFVDVIDIVRADDGYWVLDSQEPFLSWVPVDGSGGTQFGHEGRGPSELLRPVAIAVAQNGALSVWDLGNLRVSDFDREGNLLGSTPLSNSAPQSRSDIRHVTYARPHRVRRLGDAFVTAYYDGTLDRTGDFVGGILQQADWNLAPKSEILALGGLMVQELRETYAEFASVALWDACAGSVVSWSPASSTLRWTDAAGATKQTRTVRLPSRPIVRDDVTSYIEHAARGEIGSGYEAAGLNFERMARQYSRRFAKNTPYATALECGPDGEIWIRGFGTDTDPTGRGHSWARSTVDTTMAYDFPIDFVPMSFSTQDAIGVYVDPAGLQRLARWQIPPIPHQTRLPNLN